MISGSAYVQTKPENENEENVMEEELVRLLLGMTMVVTTTSRNINPIGAIYLLITETASPSTLLN